MVIKQISQADATDALIEEAGAFFGEMFSDNPILIHWIANSDEIVWAMYFANRVRVTLEEGGLLLFDAEYGAALILPPESKATVSDRLHDLDAECLPKGASRQDSAWLQRSRPLFVRQEEAMSKLSQSWRVWFVVVKSEMQGKHKGKPLMEAVMKATGLRNHLLCHKGLTKIFTAYGYKTLLDSADFELPDRTGQWPRGVGLNSLYINAA